MRLFENGRFGGKQEFCNEIKMMIRQSFVFKNLGNWIIEIRRKT